MKSIAEDTFHGSKSLQWLYLSHNQLDSIAPNTFQGLNLLWLNLSFNRLVSVEPSTFQGLNELIAIDLSMNQLESLDENAFQDLSSLRILNLAYNHFREIHATNLPASLAQFRIKNNPLAAIAITEGYLAMEELLARFGDSIFS